MQARQHTMLWSDRDLSVLDILVQLDDVERHLHDALTLVQAGYLSCQQALTAVTVLRSRISPGLPNSHRIRAADVQQNGHTAPVWLVEIDTPVNRSSEQLTAREIEVLVLIAGGHSNKQIALHLCLSVRTVERHINNIYRKIDAQNKADATAYALRNHLA